jgi:hypothetical protein
MPSEPTLIQFLRVTVAEELKSFSTAKLEYYGFVILMQAVEVTGSLFDGKAYGDFSMCETRFEKGFMHLFPDPPYVGLWKTFFTQLRGPVVHQLRPGFDFTLTCERKTARSEHFTKDQNMQTVLVFEKLLEDFTSGLDGILAKIQDGTLKGVVDASNLDGRYLTTIELTGSLRTDDGLGPLSAQP